VIDRVPALMSTRECAEAFRAADMAVGPHAPRACRCRGAPDTGRWRQLRHLSGFCGGVRCRRRCGTEARPDPRVR
jgi:hypothetical protein